MTPSERLPKPDQYGNYWLGTDRRSCPAVLHAGSEPYAPRNAHGYFASRGGSDGIIFDGTLIRYFNTPQLALDALREVQ